jgi:hypothetical protein
MIGESLLTNFCTRGKRLEAAIILSKKKKKKKKKKKRLSIGNNI